MTLTAVYPFATQDGKAIPLDILRPAAFMQCSLAGSSATFNLADYEVAVFLATEDALIKFGGLLDNILSSGSITSDTLFVPKGVLVTSSVFGNTFQARTLAGGSCNLYIQFIEKWAGLALDSQYKRKG